MKPFAILAFALLAGCGRGVPQQPRVEGAWVRLPAVAGRPGAAYFTLVGGIAPARLVGVESASVARIELHSGGMSGGMMTMAPLASVNLPPRAPVPFRPGGNHAMLFGIRPEVKAGGTVRLTYRLADGARVTADARVVGAGDPPPGDE